MRIMVESFKRLYNDSRLSKEQIAERVQTGKINEEEFKYITGEVYAS